MKFDIFFSICQTEVDGYAPSEKVMLQNFMRQVRLADDLGVGTAWVAETHLSCQVQKQNPQHVIPEFRGEIGLNTDILQLAHVIFAKTKKLKVGSAIRNIICNGGPIAHAEAIKMFLSLHGLNENESRKLEIGFAAGRFPFSNTPYGFVPKSELELAAWEVIKNKYFNEATEIFLRLLQGEYLASKDIAPRRLSEKDFRKPEEWERAIKIANKSNSVDKYEIILKNHWEFEKVGVIPFEAPLNLLNLTIGSHDPETQQLANNICPVGVFNLSITPPEVIESTHARMKNVYNSINGPWLREYMPRTVLLFIDEKHELAKQKATSAWQNYWRAMEGTLDPKKIESAVQNTIFGTPEEVQIKLSEKYNSEDRLMLWFDFNNHDTKSVEHSMKIFFEKVARDLA